MRQKFDLGDINSKRKKKNDKRIVQRRFYPCCHAPETEKHIKEYDFPQGILVIGLDLLQNYKYTITRTREKGKQNKKSSVNFREGESFRYRERGKTN